MEFQLLAFNGLSAEAGLGLSIGDTVRLVETEINYGGKAPKIALSQ